MEIVVMTCNRSSDAPSQSPQHRAKLQQSVAELLFFTPLDSKKMHHSVVLEHLTMIYVLKWIVLLLHFCVSFVQKAAKTTLRIESGNLYFGYIFSSWPQAWNMSAILTSWDRTIFTEGWASITAVCKHKQPESEKGKVYRISHQSPVSRLDYFKVPYSLITTRQEVMLDYWTCSSAWNVCSSSCELILHIHGG